MKKTPKADEVRKAVGSEQNREAQAGTRRGRGSRCRPSVVRHGTPQLNSLFVGLKKAVGSVLFDGI